MQITKDDTGKSCCVQDQAPEINITNIIKFII